MATFYPQLLSNESWSQQWQRHLKNKNVINNIDDIVKNQTNDYKYIIENSTIEQSKAIQESTEMVCGTIEDGFSMVSDHLHNVGMGIEGIRSELNSLSSMLDWTLSLLVEQQRISNLLLGNISLLLRIPDIQKERQYHIEQGMKFLKNAFFDSDFYKDSLSNLLKSEQIESTDFFTLHRIGLIYMYSPLHLDLTKAENYFRKAAKYAVAETNSGAIVTKNYLAYDLDKALDSQIPSTNAIKLQAAESYLFAGRSCYLQNKYIEAADLTGKAFDLVPGFLEAGFEEAKALAANNNESQAAVVLEKVINADRFYSLKAIADLDLCPKRSVQSLLKKLQKEATEKAKVIFQNCKKIIIQGSNATDYLSNIEKLLNKNSYLTSMKAIDLLNKNREWTFCEPFKNQSQTKYLNVMIEIGESFSYLEYHSTDSSVSDEINKNTQWNFPSNWSIKDSHSIKNISTKKENCNVLDFINIEKKYNDNLSNVVARLKIILQEATEDSNRRVEEARIKKRNEDIKFTAGSIGLGFAGGGIGAAVGLVGGIIISILLGLGSCLRGEKEANHGTLMIVLIIIGAAIGFLFGFVRDRKK